ncbi:MAG: pilus assembly protein TadE [Planctomyces sp.]|nr:pilus assembly protein TadE [Planctomyces sp.]
MTFRQRIFLPTRRQCPARHPRGAATVELAICLPIIMLVVFGSIESANAIFLKTTLTQASYEAARAVTSTGGTVEAAEARAREVLASRNVTGASISFTPTVESATPVGTMIQVKVSSPVTSLSGMFDWFTNLTRLEATTSMVRT